MGDDEGATAQNVNQHFRIVLPGYNPTDYRLELTDCSTCVTERKFSATAVVGNDIALVKYYVFPNQAEDEMSSLLPAVTSDGADFTPRGAFSYEMDNVAKETIVMVGFNADGTAVAKEASDITIIDNSFASIGRAVMWGRSLYKNIQRFLLFQLTVNVAACLLVLVGSFIGAESPLSVTQMLWVNLIMDTFGAMALASLPPSPSVMKDKPRDRNASILTRPMLTELFSIGFVLFAITLAFFWVFTHADVTSLYSMTSVHLGTEHTMTTYEATLLFSIFVWTHFWYMFDARCFDTGKSIFRVKMSGGFWTIVLIIVVGQLMITELFYEFFNVAPMIHTADWHFNSTGTCDLATIIVASSLVLWIREAYRAIRPAQRVLRTIRAA